jgi:hypothetical protein
MSIRWSRGLFRAWIVFAAVWIGTTGWLTFGPTPSPHPGKTGILQYDIPAELVSDSEIFFREAKRVSWVALPPILLLFGGFAAIWTARGFRE